MTESLRVGWPDPAGWPISRYHSPVVAGLPMCSQSVDAQGLAQHEWDESSCLDVCSAKWFLSVSKWKSWLVTDSGTRGVEGNSTEAHKQMLSSRWDELGVFSISNTTVRKWCRFDFWSVCFIEISATSQQSEILQHLTKPCSPKRWENSAFTSSGHLLGCRPWAAEVGARP